MNLTQSGGAALAAALLAAGCGGRAELWSRPPGPLEAFALATSVAIVDAPAHRVVALTVSGAADDLLVTHIPTGHDVVATAADAQGRHLYVLCAGHRAGLGDARPDEKPSLTVIDDGAIPAAAAPIDLGLTDPLNGLVIDPAGHWAVVYAGTDRGTALVTNPNELVIVNLDAGTAAHHTLHSFGGRPEQLFFTPSLGLPGGQGQLLIVQSQQDLALLVLKTPTIGETDEITVRLADAAATRRPQPAQVVVDDGDPALSDDARIGIRFVNDTSVMTLELGAAAGGNGFAPSVNVADVGGVPSDIAFVRTDGGLRLAALVPAGTRAVLVDPVTTITTDVALPAPYQHLSLVTGAAGAAGGADVALLWQGGGAGTGVAFWELGQAAGRPFRSIETVGVSASVDGVLDVPLPQAALKVLQTSKDQTFYVLDLDTRTAAPLLTATSNVKLSVSPTGQRVWTFAPGGLAVASTDISSKQVRTLRADSPVDQVFEIARSDGGGRALVALHAAGGVGATVYDVATQDDRKRRITGALLTEGPYDQD